MLIRATPVNPLSPLTQHEPKFLYEEMTWAETDAAAAAGAVAVLPFGTMEQHGPHLPLMVGYLCAGSVGKAAVERVCAAQSDQSAAPQAVLLHPVVYSFNEHHMDLPGTIAIGADTIIKYMVDIGRSLAHHGFQRIIILNGHGSNMPNLDLVARRTNLETDAECILAAWWNLLTVDKDFLPSWRESKFPGGCSHACELETSLYLYLDGDNVRKDLVKSGTISFNNDDSPFNWVDLFAAGPATVVSWTSSYSDTGVLGDAELATAAKGQQAYEEAVKQLVRFVPWFRDRPKDVRKDRHRTPPTMPLPWGQQSLEGGR